MKKHLYIIAAGLCLSLCIISCSKETSKEMSTLNLRLTDAPGDFDKVNIDIREVQVNMTDSDSSGWRTLSTNMGVYNLLSLQNGVDTLLATADVPTGTIRQVRFILGSNNTLETNGNVYELNIPSGAETGLKMNVNKNINAVYETMLVDFDAAQSVRLNTNGSYTLHPVLKLVP